MFLCEPCSSPSADWGLVSASLWSYLPEKHIKQILSVISVIPAAPFFTLQNINFKNKSLRKKPPSQTHKWIRHDSTNRTLFYSLTASRRLSMNISRVWTQSMLTPLHCSESGSRGTVSNTSRHCRGSADNRFTVWLREWEKVTAKEWVLIEESGENLFPALLFLVFFRHILLDWRSVYVQVIPVINKGYFEQWTMQSYSNTAWK